MSFLFSRLPREIKVQILRYVVPPITSPADVLDDQIISRATAIATENLIYVSKEVKGLMDIVHPITAINLRDETIEFAMDTKRDTLVVFWMALPMTTSNNSWIKSMKEANYEIDDNALPIRRLIAHSTWPMQDPSMDPGGFISRSIHAQTDANVRRWLDVPFETELPMFSRFPLLEEATVSVEQMSRSWHISGFQMEGPDVVAPRDNGESWGLNRVGLHDREAARYFQARGIEADSGLPWDLPYTNFSTNHGCLISQPEDIAPHVNQHDISMLPQDRPYIGLHGYSRGTRSLGGKWAGFRYYPQTQKVEFTPLAWHEVEPIIHRLGIIISWLVDHFLGTDPQFIGKVWIIREGVEPQNEPHHCWLEVKEPEDGDEPWVTELAAT